MENGISRYSWSLLRAMTVAAAFVPFFTPLANAMVGVKATGKYVPGELVIKLKKTGVSSFGSEFLRETLTHTLGSNAVESVKKLRTEAPLFKVKLADQKLTMTAAVSLTQNANIEYAEPNFIYTAQNVPNDPDFEKLWGLKNTGQQNCDAENECQTGVAGTDVNVVPVWEAGHTGSRNVLVAIIDTGVSWTHPDLQANIYTNPGEIPGNGIDDDGNGFIDDVHGWNFGGDNNNSSDDHSHGTHCAGTIGGVGNDGVGIVGVNWEVSILPVKFLDSDGSGSLDDAVEAIDYARKMHANIMSNSWGGGPFSQTMYDAIKLAGDENILFVAAAGNGGWDGVGDDNDGTPTYPASYALPNVLAVAAIDSQNKIAEFSNYGRNSVHVAAPGVNIYSSVVLDVRDPARPAKSYDTYSGTSMATPHVAGVAALLLSVNPGMDYATLKSRLITTSNPVRSLSRKVTAKGIINAHNALMNFVPPSNEPNDNDWVDHAQVIETEHPYKSLAPFSTKIQHPNAKFMRVHFERISLESGYDYVEIVDKNGNVLEQITGEYTDYISDYFETDELEIRIRTDDSIEDWGFKVDKYQVIENQ